jgi:hypothetical protein
MTGVILEKRTNRETGLETGARVLRGRNKDNRCGLYEELSNRIIVCHGIMGTRYIPENITWNKYILR